MHSPEFRLLEASIDVMKRLVDQQALDIAADTLELACAELSGTLAPTPTAASATSGALDTPLLTDVACLQQHSHVPLFAGLWVSRIRDAQDADKCGFGDAAATKWLQALGKICTAREGGMIVAREERLLDWLRDVLSATLSEGRALCSVLLASGMQDQQHTNMLVERLVDKVQHVQRVCEDERRTNQIQVDTEVLICTASPSLRRC
jgi:hypothetical protein